MSLYLGFDLSTQQLKIVSCYENLSFHSKYSINFDEFSEKYGIQKGVIFNKSTGEVVTPVSLWIESIQTLLDRMKTDNFPFSEVKSISGSCQQHGTVYYTSKISSILSSIDFKSNSWYDDLKDAFSFPDASNWQDRSTSQEVQDFENALGSASELCNMTGSKAHYRFSGLQIRRRARENSDAWKKTSHIGLISSFLNTFLTGELCGIEMGEACGTNLFDIQNGDWCDELLSLTMMSNSIVDGVSKDAEVNASDKARKMLGPVVQPNDEKYIADYLVNRYGFNSDCTIWPITGDNLATIMSLPLNKDDLLVSMGTSTTVLLLTEKYIPSVNYHLFRHPVCPNIYMGMLCYCNGALAREQIRDQVNEKYGGKGWDKFDEILQNRKAGDVDSGVEVYFPLGEIIPNAKPCKRFFSYNETKGLVELKDIDLSIEDEVALVIESQALSCRMRVCPMLSDDKNETKRNELVTKALNELSNIVGDKVNVDGVFYDSEEFIKRPSTVYYVGGSSKNEEIVGTFNDILGPKSDGFRVELGDACALGGCFRAIWGSSGTDIGFEEWIKANFDFKNNLERINRVQSDEIVQTTWAGYSAKIGILSLVERELDV